MSESGWYKNAGPQSDGIQEKPEIWIYVKLTDFEELANESRVLKASAGQLRLLWPHAASRAARWDLSPALPREMAPLGLHSETLSSDDPGLLRHHSEKRRLQKTSPRQAPVSSANCTTGVFPGSLGASGGQSTMQGSRINQQPPRLRSLGRRNDSTTRPGTCSPPQSHPAPPAWSGPSRTSRMWPSRLCLNRMDSCHTGGFPLSPILLKEGSCHFTLHHE